MVSAEQLSRPVRLMEAVRAVADLIREPGRVEEIRQRARWRSGAMAARSALLADPDAYVEALRSVEEPHGPIW